MKKILSVMLAAVMALGALSVSAFADDEGATIPETTAVSETTTVPISDDETTEPVTGESGETTAPEQNETEETTSSGRTYFQHVGDYAEAGLVNLAGSAICIAGTFVFLAYSAFPFWGAFAAFEALVSPLKAVACFAVGLAELIGSPVMGFFSGSTPTIIDI